MYYNVTCVKTHCERGIECHMLSEALFFATELRNATVHDPFCHDVKINGVLIYGSGNVEWLDGPDCMEYSYPFM